jgi:hypothetical protein
MLESFVGEPLELHFSECGSYLVIKLRGEAVKVRGIPRELLKDPISRISNKRLKQNQEFSTSEIAKEDQTKVVDSFGPVSGALVTNNSTKVHPYGKTTSLSTSVSDSTVKVLCEGSSGATEILLTAIPRWDGIQNTRADVKLPQCEGDNVKIVLHKEAQKRYPLCGPVSDPFPTIIERDTRFIHRPERLLRLTEDRGNTGGKPSDSGLPRKRRLPGSHHSPHGSSPAEAKDSDHDETQDSEIVEVSQLDIAMTLSLTRSYPDPTLYRVGSGRLKYL